MAEEDRYIEGSKVIKNFRPSLVALAGPPLHGKTRLASEIASWSNFLHLDVDDFRNIIDPENINRGGTLPRDEEVRLSNEAAELLCIAGTMRAIAGKPVILSCTFSSIEKKRPLLRAKETLESEGIPVMIFYLQVSEAEIMRRLERRNAEGSASNIRTLEDYRWARDQLWIPFAGVDVIEMNTEAPDYVDRTLDYLRDLRIE